jgi:hypothetical protein
MSGDFATPMTHRSITPEHMDDPEASRGELAEALHFIRVVNRRLGGTAAALKHFRRWLSADRQHRSGRIRILDVGTGSADIPLAIARWASVNRIDVHITAVDLHPRTVELARQFLDEQGSTNIELVQADALRLMNVFAQGEFDFAHAGMFLHHLQDVEVMTVLRIMDRLTTRGLVWNDLVRGWIGRVGVRLATIGAPAHVQHDAMVSVDAGFTRREAMELARRAGLSDIAFRRHVLHRFTLCSEKT